MTEEARRIRPGRGSISPDLVFYGSIAGAIALGWQMILQPLIERAPVEAAIRLAPTSASLLRRAAESELAEGRDENAGVLAREALARAPFNVKALRIIGLAEARAGRDDQANEILTLAGNWSLRDDPAHAWLVERRLRQGDYASAFAHADTLVRRRQDIQPQVFRLFTVAGIEDPQRSLPVLASLLAIGPPWRQAFLDSLNQSPEYLQVQINLALLLQAGPAPLTDEELYRLYDTLVRQGRFEAVRAVQTRLDRPSTRIAVVNGDFSDPEAPQPFQWRLGQSAGIAAEIVPDDLRPANPALRVDYNGYATGRVAEQLVFLSPGAHHFSAAVRVEQGDPAARLDWTLTCVAGGRVVGAVPAGPSAAAANSWAAIAGRFAVPSGCTAQWLRLETRAQDYRVQTIAWFDDIAIRPEGVNPSADDEARPGAVR